MNKPKEEFKNDVPESDTVKNEDSKFGNNGYEEIILGPFL